MLKRVGIWGLLGLALAAAVAALALLYPSPPDQPKITQAVLEQLAPLPKAGARAVPAPSATRPEDGQ